MQKFSKLKIETSLLTNIYLEVIELTWNLEYTLEMLI